MALPCDRFTTNGEIIDERNRHQKTISPHPLDERIATAEFEDKMTLFIKMIGLTASATTNA